MKKFLNNNLPILIVLLIAAFLRIYRVSDYMTFLGDEGRDMLVVYNILHGKFTLLGPTASVGGFFMGPIYYYFITPFLWLFNYDPVGPSVMVAILGVVTVYLVYKLGNEFFGKVAAVIASTLYAISPLVVASSRSSWNPNVMPIFSLLTAYSLYKAIQKNSFNLFLLTGLFIGIDIQLHYTELFLVGALGLYYLLIKFIFEKKQKISEKVIRIIQDTGSMTLGFIIGFSPFLLFEVRHGFPNLKSVLQFIFHSGDTGGNEKFFLIIQNVFFRLFARLIANFPPPEQIVAGLFPHILYWQFAAWTLSLASFGLFSYQVYKAYKNKSQRLSQLLLLFIWFVIEILLFGFYKKPIYDYYFESLFPLPFLFVGNLFQTVYWEHKKNTLVKNILQTGFFVLFVWLVFINVLGIPFRFAPNKQKDQVKKISDFVLSKTNGKPFNFALITGGNSDHGYRYFFKLKARDPVVIQYYGIDPQRKTVTDQLLIVCEKNPCEPVGNSLWEVAGFGRAEIADHWDLIVVQVYKLAHYKGK